MGPAAVATVLLTWLCFSACGEVTVVELSERPRLDDFETEIQPMLINMGCGRGGCHALVNGEYQLVEEPNPGETQENFLSAKAKLNLADPPRSALVYRLLFEHWDPDFDLPPHSPPCFDSVESCAYRKLLAWISWSVEGDVRPGDIDCDLELEGC